MRRLFLALLFTGAFGCQCEPPTGDDAGVAGGGRVFARAAADGPGYEIVLAGLDTPLRTLQVDVRLSGARATAVEAAGPVSFTVLEAALDEPSDDLTLVVADVRRLLLNDGPVALLVTDGEAELTLSRAIAVDDDGERRVLETSDD